MTKEFVTYEQALALKELGFDEPCLKMAMSEIDIINTERTDEGDYPKNSHLFSGWVAIPTYSAAFRWFREKYGLIGQPMPLCIEIETNIIDIWFSDFQNGNEINEIARINKFNIEDVKLKLIDFRKFAELQYPNYGKFVSHFKNWINKNPPKDNNAPLKMVY